MKLRATTLVTVGLVYLASPCGAGDGVWTTTYPFGGNFGSSTLAIDPASPSTLYAHPLWRGVYRSTDAGVTWTPRLDDVATPFDSKHMRGLEVDPAGRLFAIACCDGSGEDTLWASTDGGVTWTDAAPGAAGHATAFTIAPSDASVRYLGTQDGATFASTDGGATWSPGGGGGGIPVDAIRTLEVDPTDPDTVWTGTQSSGLFLSTDGAVTWAGANGDVTMTEVVDVLVDPAAPGTVYVADNDGGTGKTIYQTTNGGTNWVDLGTGSEFGGAAGRLVALDPADSLHLFAIAGFEVIESTDGGATWNPALTADSQLSSVQLEPGSSLVLYASTFGEGIFKSTDGGGTWATSHDGIRGLHFPHSRARSVHFDASSPLVVYAGSRHRGRRSADGGATWADMTHPQESVGTFTTTGADPGVVWSATNQLYRSTDSGLTWADGSSGAFCCFQEADVVVHPGDPATLYVGGYGGSVTDGVHKTTDGGTSWNPMSSGIGDPRIRMLAIDPNDGETVYAAATDDGPGNAAVYKTTDGGAGWTQLGGLPADFYPNQIVVHPLDSNLLYLTAEGGQGGLYRSTDGGGSWQLLLSDNGTAVAVHPGDTSRISFGTWNTSGFWRSLDGGTTWALLNEGLPVNPGLESIAVDPVDPDRLLMATAGGAYEIDLAVGTVELTVTITDDSGPGSLRDALTQASQDGVPNRIRFAPWLAGFTIFPATPLPGLQGGTDLDGDLDGDCVPDVALDGQWMPNANGLNLSGDGNRVAGLAIHSFDCPGCGGDLVVVGFTASPSDGNLIECNYLGTDLGGGTDLGTQTFGIKVYGGSTGNVIRDNRIVWNGTGIQLLEGSSGNVIGPGNEITLSDGPGIDLVDPGTVGNTITENAIHDNGGLAVDLGGDGVTANDPGDGDAGPNDLLNYPEITLVTPNGGGSFTVDGTAPPNSTVELFVARSDPSGHGEADLFVGSVPADGAGLFSHTFVRDPELFRVTATATDGSGNTSELSEAVLLEPNALEVTTVADGGAGSLRVAIDAANGDTVPTIITFAPGLAGQTIVVLSQLPDVTEDETTIDGDLGGDCVPDVEISGILTGGGTDGLALTSSDNVVRGLAFVDFPGDGMEIVSQGPPADRNVVECTHVGVRLDGVTAAGNGERGLLVHQGASDNRIGPGSVVAENGQDGIRIGWSFDGSRRNTVTQTATFENGEEGIDLAGDGPTPNDPGDGDGGPNDLLNYPEITGSVDNGGGNFDVSGTAPPDSTVELYGVAADPSGFGEGRLYLGSTVATGAGDFAASVTLGPDLFEVTATATDLAGNTSELGPNWRAKAPDSVSIGGGAGHPGDVVAVPLSVRDLSVTPLGVDQGAGLRIQAFTIQVRISPASSVSAANGVRAGIAAGLTPLLENTTVLGDTVTYLAAYAEGANTIPFTLDGPVPGDHVADLELTIDGAAPPTPVTLTVLGPGTSLANQGGTVEETEAAGTLELFHGTLTVLSRAAGGLVASPESSSQVRLDWLDPNAGETGFRVERSPDGGAWGTIATLGPDATTLTDSGLPAGTLFYYRVVSFSGGGDNPSSNVAAALTFPAAAPLACIQPLSHERSWARWASPVHTGSRWAVSWGERVGWANDDVFLQFLDDATGTPVGVPLQITDDDTSTQVNLLRWNGNHFGLMWGRSLRGPLGELPGAPTDFFSLLDANGQRLRHGVRLSDTEQTFLNNTFEAGDMAWDGGGWGRVAITTFDPDNDDIGYWRFTEEGERLSGPVRLTSDPDSDFDVSLAWSGSEYGLAWIRRIEPSTSEVWFRRLLPDGTDPAGGDPGPVLLWQSTSSTWANTSTIVWDGGGWAIAWADFPDATGEGLVLLRRVDALGAPQGGGATRLSDDVDAEAPGAPVNDDIPELVPRPGGGYLCYTSSWHYPTNSYDVAVLEADAAGDRVGGRRFLSDADGAHSVYERVATDGARFLVAANDTRQGTVEIAGLLTDGAGNLSDGPHDLTSGHSPGNPWAFENPIVAAAAPLAGGGFVTLWTDNRDGSRKTYGRLFDAAGNPAGDLDPLSGRGTPSGPAMVGVGDTFAVAYKDENQSIVFSRHDSGGGALTGELELATGTGGRQGTGIDYAGILDLPLVGYTGEVYGVAWIQSNEIVFQRVDPGGGLLGAPVMLGSGRFPPHVRWVGTGWMLVWQDFDRNLYLGHVDPFGAVTFGPQPITATGGATSQYDVAWGGGLLGIAWRENRGAGLGGDELYFTALTRDGAVVVPELQTFDSANNPSQPRLFWQGDRFHQLRAGGPLGSAEYFDGIREDEILTNGTVISDVRLHANRGGLGAIAFDGLTTAVAMGTQRELSFQTSACLDDPTPPVCPDVTLSFDDVAIGLDWNDVSDPESTIWRYHLYRDGILLDERFDGHSDYADWGWRPDTVHTYEVRAMNGAYQESSGCPVHTWSTVIGDANGSGGVDVADIFYLINFLFGGGGPPRGDADANGSGSVTSADVFYLVNLFFGGGPPPLEPTTPLGPADELSVGSVPGEQEHPVTVPIFLRDLSGTPLDEGLGFDAEIQGFALRVDFDPAVVASSGFQQAGATEGLTPVSPIVLPATDHIVVLMNFDQVTDPLTLGLDGPAPGDVIGELVLVLRSNAPLGATPLSLEAATATLVNHTATVSETVAAGNLVVFDGEIVVGPNSDAIFVDGFESGDVTAWSSATP